jgi:aspartate racemase
MIDAEGSSAAVGRTSPLSPAQQLAWTLSQLRPYSTAAFDHQSAWRLEGPLDVTALTRGLNEIVRRHGALRASVRVVAGRPVQVVAPALTVDVPVVDLRRLANDQQESEIQWRIADDGSRPFDLARGPLLQGSLLRLAEDQHLLLMRVHCTVFDAWSDGIFWRELTTLYRDFVAGRPSSLTDLPMQYADFCERQWRGLQNGSVLEGLTYWKRRLEGRPSLIDLPVDRPRPAVQSWRSGSLVRTLPDHVAQALASLSRREGVDLFVTMLAAFQTFLGRYTGQEDLLVASAVHGRTHPDATGLIGCFANNLVLRTDLSGDPTFVELLRRVQETTEAAYAHQDLPFERVVQEVEPEWNLSHMPLAQVMFLLQDAFERPFDRCGLSARPLAIKGHTICDLTLTVLKEGQRLSARWEYNADLFDTPTVARMAGHFQTLLEGIVADPDRAIAALPLLTAEQRRQVLFDWNQTRTDDPRERCVHHEFEEQAERTPDAIALDSAQGQLTYRDLNSRANQLAHYLRALGVGRNVLVGICLERSWELLVGMLGVLKAAGAYVPLDPTYPAERLALQLDNARVPVLLTQSRLVKSLPRTAARVVCLDSQWEEIGRWSEENPQPAATADSLMYVIYTSGSTGTPKGVMVSHKAVSNYVAWFKTEFGVDPADRVLQFASIAFDTSVEEIFPALTSGATLVLRSDEMLSSMATFLEKCREAAITVIDLPTAFWHELIPSLSQGVTFPESIRLVVIGGEKALGGPLADWRLRVAPRVRLSNTYGPTEATVCATACDLAGTSVTASSPLEVPIGKPIHNVQAYILDSHLQPVPIGVRGELWIGGVGVAKGYLNDPDLTGKRFVADPFSQSPTARLYRTGDLARYRPDGHIEFLGRVDHQVKIRGFRVELGEIEAVLVQHPAVREAVVVAQEEVRGRNRLVAHLVAHPDRRTSVDDLRHFVKTRLPPYMVPAAFMWLDAFPLTPSGKVDRGALRLHDTPVPATRLAGVPSIGVEERRLLQIWEEVLGIHPIRVTDNFFALGGDSLGAARLLAEVAKVSGKDLPPVTLLQAPTVAQMAAFLRDDTSTPIMTPLVPIQPEGSRLPFFCVHQDAGNVLGYGALARYLGPDQPIYGLQAVEREGIRLPDVPVEHLARRYVDEICRLLPDGPYLLGGHSFGGAVAFEMARQLEAQGRTVGLLALFDTFNPAYLASLPGGLLVRHIVGRYLTRSVVHGKRVLLGPRRIRYVQEKAQKVVMKTLSIGRPAPLDPHGPPPAYTDAGYVPRPYGGRITLFKANVATYDEYRDRWNGWRDQARDGVEVFRVPGDHRTLLSEPHVRILATRLAACLEAEERQSRRRIDTASPSLAVHLVTMVVALLNA